MGYILTTNIMVRLSVCLSVTSSVCLHMSICIAYCLRTTVRCLHYTRTFHHPLSDLFYLPIGRRRRVDRSKDVTCSTSEVTWDARISCSNRAPAEQGTVSIETEPVGIKTGESCKLLYFLSELQLSKICCGAHRD